MTIQTASIRIKPLEGASKNADFAQMQGVEKICEHLLRGLPAYPTSATQHNQPLVRLRA